MLLISIDSTLVQKIGRLSENIDFISRKTTLNPWIPLLAAVLGAILLWIGQYLDRSDRKKQEKRKEIISVFAKCEMLLFLVKNQLKELSTQRNLRTFWWHCHYNEITAEDGNLELAKTYYDNCLKHSNNSINVNLKIGETLSEYLSNISTFTILTNTQIDTNSVKYLLFEEEFRDSDEIDLNLDSNDALSAYNANNLSLSKEYIKKCAGLDKINDSLQNICIMYNKKT